MALSRHFYALDEVHAALTYCSTRNDRYETVFWCQELLSSGCISETISTLFEAWLWHKGPFSLSWLSLAETLAGEEVTEEDVLRAAYQLSWISHERRDHSLWSILVLTAANAPPEAVTPRTPPYLPPNVSKEELYFFRALAQGKAYSAWWMARRLPAANRLLRWYVVHNCPVYAERYLNAFELWERYECLLGYRTPEYDVVMQCLAVLSVCLQETQREDSWRELPRGIEEGVQRAIEDSAAQWGTVAQRRYRIPTACLYGTTQRGRMKWSESTVGALARIQGCPFWDEARAAYELSTDEGREAFYDRYVPDPIPDEWSKEEKEKSHGGGVLGPTESLSLAKFSRLYLSHDARLAWNRQEEVQRFLAPHPMNSLSWIVSLFSLESQEPPWTPRHRARRI